MEDHNKIQNKTPELVDEEGIRSGCGVDERYMKGG
jgi:hypothetical protein